MAEPSNHPPRRLKASEALLLEYLREHADADGCAGYTKAELATALGLARSTLALSVSGLRALELLSVHQSAGARSNIYCVTPSDSAQSDRPITVRLDRPIGPSDSAGSPGVDAPLRERAAATRPPVVVPPTPLVTSYGNLTDDPSRDAPAPARALEPSDAEPSDVVPIGRLACAAAAEAATAAGRKLEGSVMGRLGRAAQALAAEHDAGAILAAARRIGEGAGDDLYTALRAVERGAALPRSVRAEQSDHAYADLQRRAEFSRQGRDPLWLGRLKPGEIVEAEALYVGTYGERRRFDAELWARELHDFPIGAILYGIRAMAKASPHPPTWGEVAAAAGQTLEHERRKRANERARHEDAARV